MPTPTIDDTTMTIRTADGTETGPFMIDDLDNARERLRAEHDDAPSQLSFDLGMGRRDSPDFATLKVSGSLSVTEDLLYGQHVTITVTDHHGEVLSQETATVGYPAFKAHFDKYGTKTVERIHAATIDA